MNAAKQFGFLFNPEWAVKQDGPVLVGFESLWLAEENHPATILWYIEFCSLYRYLIQFRTMFIFAYSTVIDFLLRDIRIYIPKFSGMKAGDRVLDICCGTGKQALHYAKMGIIATGIDLNPGMIRMAGKNRRKQSLENVSFQMADALNLPFKDNCFDYASISFGLHEKERAARNKIISEMKRVVKKEGALVFVDFKAPLPRNAYSYLIKSIEFMAGREHFRYFKDYIEQGGLDELLKKNHLHEKKEGYLKDGTVAITKTRNV